MGLSAKPNSPSWLAKLVHKLITPPIPSLQHIQRIIPTIPQLQMLRIHTQPIITLVQHQPPFRNRPIPKSPRHPVCSLVILFTVVKNHKLPITVAIMTSCPQPAPTTLFHTIPEPRFNIHANNLSWVRGMSRASCPETSHVILLLTT